MTSGSSLYLGITAEDMIKLDSYEDSQNNYYATQTQTSSTSPVASNHTTDERYFSVAKVSLKDGDQGTKYHCTAQVQVSVEGLDAEGLDSQLQEADGLLSLKFNNTTTGGTVTANLSTSSSGQPGTENTSIDLKELATYKSENPKTYYLSYDFTRGTDTEDVADLQASFKITNTEKEQNYLAGKNIVITIKSVDTAGDLKCEIAKDAD